MTRWRHSTRGGDKYGATINGVDCFIASREGGLFWDAYVKIGSDWPGDTYATLRFAKAFCKRVARMVGKQ